MNLQNPKKFKMMIDQAHDVAINVLGEPHLFLNARRISLMEGPYV